MPKPGIALQMFSLRDEARTDYVGTLRKVVAATSAEWLIVEQDFSDRRMLDSLAISRNWLRSHGYG